MPLGRLTVAVRSLRFQLTLWNTLVVLLIIVAAVFGVREGLRFYLIEETDQSLDDEVIEMLLRYEKLDQLPNGRELFYDYLETKAEGHRARQWHIRWLDLKRETIWASEFAPPRPLAILQADRDERKTWISDSYRSIERPIRDRSGQKIGYFRVGAPLEFVENDVDRLTNLLAPLAIGFFLLAPVGGFLLAGRAIAPIRNLIETTERLRPSQMNERLVIRGTGDELDHLAMQINHFLDQIGEHLRREREFVANAAHELRSPLAAMQSSVQVTLENLRTPEEYQEMLYNVDDEIQHLSQLINRLLELAETDSQANAESQAVLRLDEVAQKTLEMFEPVAEEKGVRLEGQLAPVSMQGNRQQMRQVLTNLVDNALKFTPADGRVLVTTRVVHDEGRDWYELVVEDNGIGVPPEDLGRIFERFYQVDRSRARSDERRGTGLGLSICQAIVHAHHGTIRAESQLGQGTRFTARFPIPR